MKDDELNKMIDDVRESRIPIHWLHTQRYCEYQIYLENVVGLEAPPTAEMLRGSEIHDNLDEEHEKRAELEMTVKEALIKAPQESIVLVSRDVPVMGSALIGRIDEVAFEPSRILIIDDKPSAVAYITNKVQVWGYCQAFQEFYQPGVPIFGALRQEDTGIIVWQEEFLPEHSTMVVDSVNRIRAILSGQMSAQPTGNIRKCQSCRLRESCSSYGEKKR